jgi:hypothetical protein
MQGNQQQKEKAKNVALAIFISVNNSVQVIKIPCTGQTQNSAD